MAISFVILVESVVLVSVVLVVECISALISVLARDLSADIMSLLSSTRPYLRKKAVLILYKVFLRYPDALRPAFPRDGPPMYFYSLFFLVEHH